MSPDLSAQRVLETNPGAPPAANSVLSLKPIARAPEGRSTPPALISAVVALVVVAFAGVAVAIIMAVSGGGTGGSAAPTDGGVSPTAITVISHAH
jgi:hypothetical protein